MTRRPSLVMTTALMLLIGAPSMDAQECYESSIRRPTPFMGKNDEIFTLADGTVWQVKYEYEYLYEYYPSVIICPSRGKLMVAKKTLNVQLLAGSPKASSSGGGQWQLFEETHLQGSISGSIQRGHIFKTLSGNIYEVTGLTLQLVLALSPSVMVLRNGDIYKLIVDGFDEPLLCQLLNPGRSAQGLAEALPRPPAESMVADEPNSSAAPREVTVAESVILGSFGGLRAGAIYPLANGQIWQQTEAWDVESSESRPSVRVYWSNGEHKMKVRGIEHAVTVRRLK